MVGTRHTHPRQSACSAAHCMPLTMPPTAASSGGWSGEDMDRRGTTGRAAWAVSDQDKGVWCSGVPCPNKRDQDKEKGDWSSSSSWPVRFAQHRTSSLDTRQQGSQVVQQLCSSSGHVRALFPLWRAQREHSSSSDGFTCIWRSRIS